MKYLNNNCGIFVLCFALVFLLYMSRQTFIDFKPFLIPVNNNNINENESEYNIIFLETNSMRDYLNKRQLCAVESAALNNPAAKIIVYSIKAEINKQLLNFYSNIRLLKIEFNEFIKKTPFEEWYKLNKNLLLNGPS